jgi:chlorobactene glucosyltransferase
MPRSPICHLAPILMRCAIIYSMNRQHHEQRQRPNWPRVLLWTHAIGVIAFYLILWFRTNPKEKKSATQAASRQCSDGEEEAEVALPFVSIIVPARNEERNIRRCVESLLQQDYEGPFEVIVVDDGSTDATAAILAEIGEHHSKRDRVRVLHLHEQLPQGWAGKPHAIHCGTQLAHGDWLLFTDADTWHAPGALRFATRKARAEQADLLTISSEQELPGFWNKVMMPLAFMGISMLYPPRLVNDPRSPVAVANGQFILIRRAVFDIIGGYARPDLRGTLLDDRDLGRVVKENGFRLRFDDGRSVLHVRMYNNLNETWRGWRKNAFLGNRGGLPFFIIQLIGLPMITIVPFLLPLLGLFAFRREITIAALAELTPLVAYRLWLNSSLNVPWYYVATHPLAGGLFEGILAQSAWRVVRRKGVDWRGRQYFGAKPDIIKV